MYNENNENPCIMRITEQNLTRNNFITETKHAPKSLPQHDATPALAFGAGKIFLDIIPFPLTFSFIRAKSAAETKLSSPSLPFKPRNKQSAE